MENDTESIRKLGEKMMGGFSSPKSSSENFGNDKKGVFEMPSFGGESKQDIPDAKDMFGGGFGLASSEDSDKLKELGKRMMGQ
jgi:hypothetical protein